MKWFILIRKYVSNSNLCYHIYFIYHLCTLFIFYKKRESANKLKKLLTTLVWLKVEPTLWIPQIYHPLFENIPTHKHTILYNYVDIFLVFIYAVVAI